MRIRGDRPRLIVPLSTSFKAKTLQLKIFTFTVESFDLHFWPEMVVYILKSKTKSEIGKMGKLEMSGPQCLSHYIIVFSWHRIYYLFHLNRISNNNNNKNNRFNFRFIKFSCSKILYVSTLFCLSNHWKLEHLYKRIDLVLCIV